MADLQPLIRYAEVRAALGFAGNDALNRALKRHNIRPVEINSRVKGLTREMYDLLLSRASGKEMTA